MLRTRIRWSPGFRREALEGLAFARLRQAGEHLQNATRQTLGVAAVSEAASSRPGETPRRRSGELQESVELQADELNGRVRVGSTLPYAAALELGTSQMAARPFLRRTLAEEQAALARLVEGGNE